MDIFTTNLISSLTSFIPEIALIIMLIMAVFLDVLFGKKYPLLTGVFSVCGFVAVGVLLISCYTAETFAFTGLLATDPLSNFFKLIILSGSIVTVFMTFGSNELRHSSNSIGEFYILLIGMVLGMFLLSSASNLLMIYLAFEMMSLSSYILAGYTKEIKRASEASLKYVIYGSLASGLMIYGMSLLFGLTSSLDLHSIIGNYSSLSTDSVLAFNTALLLIFAGIAYKISAVPFHFWTPDVYEGSPVATTALLSVVSKAAGFAVLIRFVMTGASVFSVNLPSLSTLANNHITAQIGLFDWPYFMAIIAVLTMTLGNLIAVWQENMKRMLAYSSIAHCGYMLMGVMVMNPAGIEGVMFYFVTYLLMNFGAFLVVQLIANKTGSEDITDYNGLAYKNPFIAGSLTIFLLSLMGMPPFAGFIAKLYLFTPVIEAGYVGIAVIGVLNSVVSVFYYVKVVRNMYLRGDVETTERLNFGAPNMLFLSVLTIPVALLIINFEPILEWVRYSAKLIAN